MNQKMFKVGKYCKEFNEILNLNKIVISIIIFEVGNGSRHTPSEYLR